MIPAQLSLSGDELTLIMRGLGKLPLEETFDLFVKLRLHIHGQQTPTAPDKPASPEPPKQSTYDPDTGIVTYPDGRTHNQRTGEIVWPDGSKGHDLVKRLHEDVSHLEPHVEHGMG